MKIKWLFRKFYNQFLSKDRIFVRNVSKLLGFVPVRISLYKLVFKHKSKHRSNNERLEFLGDSILSSIISNELYNRYPRSSEGTLSQLRARLVSRKMLNEIGAHFDLTDLLDYQLSHNHENTNLSGNTLEALIGAVYLDQGYAITKAFVFNKITDKYIDWEDIEKRKLDYKSLLYHQAQTKDITLFFTTVDEVLDQGKTRYTMAAMWDNQQIAVGYGKNKKTAEQEAAKKALDILKFSENEK